jgi:hypothetical protein
MRAVTTVDTSEQPQETLGSHVYEEAEMKWMEVNGSTMINKTTDIIGQALVVKKSLSCWYILLQL